MRSSECRSSSWLDAGARALIVGALLALWLSGAVAAQPGHTDPAGQEAVPGEAARGTVIVLPDGTRCLPVQGKGSAAAGSELEHLCGDGLPRGLVGGVLESGGQVSLEVVDLGAEQAPASGTGGHRLALFRVQQLVLENGAVCTPAASSTVQGADRPVTYECGDGWASYVVLGSVERLAGDDPSAYHVHLASLGDDGAVSGAAQQVGVAVMDGQLPFTRDDWVLSSWGTGQAPPVEGSAPTLSFSEGMINGGTGCNSYFAPASILSEGRLELGATGATLMACTEELMAQETRFMAALDGVIGYELIDGDLYLYGGAEVLRFERAAR